MEDFGWADWNYTFIGKVVILSVAGYLSGWEKVLNSIIFQFASTQVLNSLYRRYQKQTLLIITDKADVCPWDNNGIISGWLNRYISYKQESRINEAFYK